jgi:hypothetical protein
MTNPFSSNAFSMMALTDAINILPNNYGRAESLGIFKTKSTRLRHIAVEERNGVLTLLPTQLPGSPATVGVRGKRVPLAHSCTKLIASCHRYFSIKGT